MNKGEQLSACTISGEQISHLIDNYTGLSEGLLKMAISNFVNQGIKEGSVEPGKEGQAKNDVLYLVNTIKDKMKEARSAAAAR